MLLTIIFGAFGEIYLPRVLGFLFVIGRSGVFRAIGDVSATARRRPPVNGPLTATADGWGHRLRAGYGYG